jgi:hypothetical protein
LKYTLENWKNETLVKAKYKKQLSRANNDTIELGWLKRELHLTDQTKFDGMLFKVGGKSVSPALVEFAGSINDHTSIRKMQMILRSYM